MSSKAVKEMFVPFLDVLNSSLRVDILETNLQRYHLGYLVVEKQYYFLGKNYKFVSQSSFIELLFNCMV